MRSPTLQLDDDGAFYVSVGELVAGKYRVERVLGSGGMAFVLSAKHVELEQHFALKFLDERFLGNATVTERFTQEAKAACRIRSEHVALVYDVGIHNGAPFFVMEHLEGRDLQAVVTESGPLRVDDAVEYVMQACEALAVAHGMGIVHRDIKPENLFLVERSGLPIVKVLDFGISKVALTGGQPASRLTGELTLGTPCYMSPEQIRSTTSVDARSDQWSLGVVLYELLAGTEAFRADSVNAVCAAVLEREPPPLSELRPDLPPGLAEVVMKCLQKDAERRFADVAELAVALLPFAPTRALVSAERSSSVMRGARRAVALERPSGEPGCPASAAPVARTIASIPDAPAAGHAVRRWPVALGTAALGAAVLIGLLAFGVFETPGHGASHSGAVVAPAAPPPEPAMALTAVRRTVLGPAAEEERAPDDIVAIPVSHLASASPTLPTGPRPSPPARAPAGAQPSSLPDAIRAKRPAVAASSGATPAPSVELGY